MLFFKCMAALLDPIQRRGEGVKWGLVTYTVVMFSFATALTAINLNILSASYIGNREFPGVGDLIPPGPLGYQASISPDALNIVPNVLFILCNWLADGLLVSSLFDPASAHPWCLMPDLSLALSLLRNLLQEHLGHRLPLPHVPWLIWCAFKFSANQWRYPGLIVIIQ